MGVARGVRLRTGRHGHRGYADVLLGAHGASFPTVHGVTGGGVKMLMHCPPHGTPLVHVMVGVQTAVGVQGASSPTVQGVTGGGVGVGVVLGGPSMHWPPVDYTWLVLRV